MDALSDHQILTIWEAGLERGPAERAVALLSVAQPTPEPRELAALPLGQRDRRLFKLRKQTFGGRLSATTECPACHHTTGFAIEMDDVLAVGEPGAPPTPFTLEVAGFDLSCRLLDSHDLAAVEALDDAGQIRHALLQRAVPSATFEGGSISPGDLPREVVEALGEALEERDPMAHIPLDLTCAACGHHWLPTLDIATWLWHEVRNRAECLLTDVQTLAITYGWNEAEILAISPLRRRFYLENSAAQPRPTEDET